MSAVACTVENMKNITHRPERKPAQLAQSGSRQLKLRVPSRKRAVGQGITKQQRALINRETLHPRPQGGQRRESGRAPHALALGNGGHTLPRKLTYELILLAGKSLSLLLLGRYSQTANGVSGLLSVTNHVSAHGLKSSRNVKRGPLHILSKCSRIDTQGHRCSLKERAPADQRRGPR